MEGGNNGEFTSAVRKKLRFRSLYVKIKAFSPIPYLLKALDFYVRSMSQCAGRANYKGLAAGGFGVSAIALPRSFTISSLTNDDEFADLVRAASQRSISSPAAQGRKKIPIRFRTNDAPSVGRIDEDSPCYFPGSFRKTGVQADLRYPRTRSYHPARTSGIGEEIVEFR
ncbi:hypothetical protein SUGI_0558720 [Cryptomeria japonica]|nr:hypothetical protein SUGI_0558720 [Cryptomeria japonica]